MSDLYSELYDAIRDHEQMHEEGAPVEDVIHELCEVGTRPEDLVREGIDKMRKQGEIWSPDGGDHYRLTDRNP